MTDRSEALLDARMSAQEARSGGVTWTFSPMLDVSRDPRWGRVAEDFDVNRSEERQS